MTEPCYVMVDQRFDEFVDTARAPEQIVHGFAWTEGPVWLDGAPFFNDIANKRMMRWTKQACAEVALDNSEFANGNTLDGAGQVVSGEHAGRRVIRRPDPTDPSAVEVIAERSEGKRLNSPNEVVVRSDGSVWFTNPPYGINSDIEGYPAESEIGGCFVFCPDPDGTLHAVATEFDKPNELAFSPDECRLFVADSGAIRGAIFPGIDDDLPHHVRVFDVDGVTLSNGRVFAVVAPGAPDGFRVDHEGYVWTSALDGIHCLSPEGALIGKIWLPRQTSIICFGGPPGQTMFITSSDKVYRVESTRRDAAHALRDRERNAE